MQPGFNHMTHEENSSEEDSLLDPKKSFARNSNILAVLHGQIIEVKVSSFP